MYYFKLKCRCGFEEVVEEWYVDWNEDETCNCQACGRELHLNRSKIGYGYNFHTQGEEN